MTKKTTSPTKKQIAEWKRKAEKWDALDEKIAPFYAEDEEGNFEKEGDIMDIGEIAAVAFGYL